LGVKGGASIAAYREYFPKARIYGIDIDPHCKEFHDPSKNIFIEIMSQTDESAINTFLKDTKFDIILDDASHVNKFTIASYNILNNRVKSNGIYIIEDL
jgi:23S rRNA U2552 (ribose-2'-O)-methylase RlmE/FtsJ